MAPWLRDAEGNDVFDDTNDPLSGQPIFDPIDAERTLGSAFGDTAGDVGGVVDDVDGVLRDVNATNPFAIVADSGTSAASDARDQPRQFKAILLGVAALVVLYLLRPLLTIFAGVVTE